MKTTRYYLLAKILVLSMLLFYNCLESKDSDSLTKNSKYYIETNEYIELDGYDYNDVSLFEMISPEEKQMLKAAAYRFYSHVYLDENGIYKTDLVSGSDINISEILFENYKLGLTMANEYYKNINMAKSKNDKVEGAVKPEPISEEYLQSLLVEDGKNQDN